MLKQLLKYEFKATGRTYGGLYLALVALAVLSGFSLRSSSKDNFASLLLFAYMVVAVAVAVVSVMTIVTRFTRNLLGREGYLMHTLPVTESQLILSKLISSVVWMLCSSIVGIFSFAVMLLALSLNSAALQQLPELWQKVVEIFREIFRMTGSSGWLWLAFETLNGLVALVSSILCIYAACMIGHQFKKHMVPAGILAFFLLSFLQNWLSSGVSSADMLQAVSDPTLGGVDVSIAAPSAFTTLLGLAVSIAFAAGYFLLTRWIWNDLNVLRFRSGHFQRNYFLIAICKRPNHKLHLIQKTSASCPIPGKACRCFSCYKVFSTRRTAFSGSSGIPPRFPGWCSPALQRYRAFPALQSAGWCGSPPCLPALHP